MMCSVSDCDKAAQKRGWCEAHYRRFMKHGTPFGGSTPKGAARKFLERAKRYQGEDCLYWPFGTNGGGYGLIGFNGKMRPVHRLICEFANGAPPSTSHESAHSCGQGHLGCVAPRHLSWKTHRENQADKLAHGTQRRGECVPTAKLTAADVTDLRSLIGTMSQQAIADRFGVSQSTVSKIRRGRLWREQAGIAAQADESPTLYTTVLTIHKTSEY